MKELKALFAKAKDFVTKTYDFDSKMNKYDYVIIGVLIGSLLATAKSVILAVAVIGILAHLAYKRS